ncbi:phosphotransferase [Rhizohabitans arisaemae]|uniref:phosphotransferase n=1 Tax=Rhizohabitans arisaemae TaxID=2720610 RepID=UPI0024B0515F|nr:phosphotransferase [Rhizohabitans arisaemae]
MSVETESRHPPASGVRISWDDVHPPVRSGVERFLGGKVIEAATQHGGFSPGAAVRLRVDTGRRAFVKAVSPAQNDVAVRLYRAEARATAALPEAAPAPRLLDTFELDDWVTLIFEDIDGRHPMNPWRRDELDRVFAESERMPVMSASSGCAFPMIAEEFDSAFRGWRSLIDSDVSGLDPWASRHLDGLVELETGWAAAAAGDSLVHGDLRADNILLTPDRVYFVDWAYPCVGAPWFDRLAMAPSIAMQGGPPPRELIADPDPAITRVVAAFAGFLVWQSRLPDPPGLPTVRSFQRAQGLIALDWLRERTGWD